ncbi:hypothetical protein GT755_27240 [Herbidospora sp. NEAU-GS84]|uniref:Uncharacterized protein n=1 Tax=Herbidospora solisilvae TaxID=2696284 RepID=A0A7C9J5M8_9ACTN|nr:hypothetical protein [Herbidospora solisilvae]NAS25367.1 hypothetical protein [Herbidospora solisilvae]
MPESLSAKLWELIKVVFLGGIMVFTVSILVADALHWFMTSIAGYTGNGARLEAPALVLTLIIFLVSLLVYISSDKRKMMHFRQLAELKAELDKANRRVMLLSLPKSSNDDDPWQVSPGKKSCPECDGSGGGGWLSETRYCQTCDGDGVATIEAARAYLRANS